MFHDIFKNTIVGGYKKESVLQYIEQLTIEIEVKTAELEREKQALSRFVVETEVNATQKLADANRRSDETMARAEQQAERLLAQAQDQAKNTLVQSQDQAQNILAQAQLQAQQIIAQTELKAAQTMDAAEAQKNDIMKSCDSARKFVFRVYGMYQDAVNDSMKLLLEGENENGCNSNGTT